ncbi:TetR/AcrR family transcriptional regulator [Microbulbifer sp. OS29]|uniref:TetR/AcrR family transcriptional regulator n=1 Tax=Microbulbifer okhotskensis TaxID=2926617 RepID=A0A9X2EQN7_9GAMM|nr:TetR/AcrR family transcriptional regulator [Microbulbifer okhotskensis]MCO1336679.1 TetR/AcrR family transcriptional regulator [Microbulbifer okhotskensis]
MSKSDPSDIGSPKGRTKRADSLRNQDALLQAAKEVFAISGVDAPVRKIAGKAGVGVGTLYRHYPNRADLIAAVFRREIDSCNEEVRAKVVKLQPFPALAMCMQRLALFFATKRGLSEVLHSGDPAFESLPSYFDQHLRPMLKQVLDTAIDSGEVRSDIEADELLGGIARLAMSSSEDSSRQVQRMVTLLADGLRFKE